jgi:hypothetical protein
MGLAAFCYEGGPSLGGDAGGAIWRTAWGDIRMKQEVIDTQYIMEDYGADGGNYLSVGGQDPIVKDAPGITWEYVRNVWNPTEGSPKMQGIDELNNTTVKRAPTAGVATGPAGFLAAKYVRASWWPAQHDTNAASVAFNYLRDYNPWGLGYFVRAPSAGTYRLRLQYTVPVATRVRVVANGHIAGILNLPAATSATWSSDINVNLGAGANGIRLLNLDADGTLYNVIIQP